MEKRIMNIESSLRDKIPVAPLKPLPLEDVPIWTKLPYDIKYPLPACSEKVITLSREELGKSLYQRFPEKEFDLTQSPVPHLGGSSYNSLHDPYLGSFFRSSSRFKNLVRTGMVTKDGKVKCGLQEYNQYRMYLYHLWVMQVNQLMRNQMSEETSRFKNIFKAQDNEDPLFKDIANNRETVNVEEILEEVITKLLQDKEFIFEHGLSPSVHSAIQWKSYQERLMKNFRNRYPAIKQWLCDQSKHYRHLMENKLNARINRDRMMRSRWDRICERSRARLEKELKQKELQKERMRALSEQRYNKAKNQWAKTEREIKSRRKTLRQPFTNLDISDDLRLDRVKILEAELGSFKDHSTTDTEVADTGVTDTELGSKSLDEIDLALVDFVETYFHLSLSNLPPRRVYENNKMTVDNLVEEDMTKDRKHPEKDLLYPDTDDYENPDVSEKKVSDTSKKRQLSHFDPSVKMLKYKENKISSDSNKDSPEIKMHKVDMHLKDESQTEDVVKNMPPSKNNEITEIKKQEDSPVKIKKLERKSKESLKDFRKQETHSSDDLTKSKEHKSKKEEMTKDACHSEKDLFNPDTDLYQNPYVPNKKVSEASKTRQFDPSVKMLKCRENNISSKSNKDSPKIKMHKVDTHSKDESQTEDAVKNIPPSKNNEITEIKKQEDSPVKTKVLEQKSKDSLKDFEKQEDSPVKIKILERKSKDSLKDFEKQEDSTVKIKKLERKSKDSLKDFRKQETHSSDDLTKSKEHKSKKEEMTKDACHSEKDLFNPDTDLYQNPDGPNKKVSEASKTRQFDPSVKMLKCKENNISSDSNKDSLNIKMHKVDMHFKDESQIDDAVRNMPPSKNNEKPEIKKQEDSPVEIKKLGKISKDFGDQESHSSEYVTKSKEHKSKKEEMTKDVCHSDKDLFNPDTDLYENPDVSKEKVSEVSKTRQFDPSVQMPKCRENNISSDSNKDSPKIKMHKVDTHSKNESQTEDAVKNIPPSKNNEITEIKIQEDSPVKIKILERKSKDFKDQDSNSSDDLIKSKEQKGKKQKNQLKIVSKRKSDEKKISEVTDAHNKITSNKIKSLSKDTHSLPGDNASEINNEFSKKSDEKMEFLDESKKIDEKDCSSDQSLPTTRVKEYSLNFDRQAELVKFLYGLPIFHEQNRTEMDIKEYLPQNGRKDGSLSDKEKAKDVDEAEKSKDATVGIIRTGSTKVLEGKKHTPDKEKAKDTEKSKDATVDIIRTGSTKILEDKKHTSDEEKVKDLKKSKDATVGIIRTGSTEILEGKKHTSDEEKAKDVEKADQSKNATSDIIRTGSTEILEGKKQRDVWKELEISLKDAKKKVQDRYGLKKETLLEQKDQRIWRELCKNEFYTSTYIRSLRKKQVTFDEILTVHYPDEEKLKFYRTDSEDESGDESKEEKLKRIFYKSKAQQKFSNKFIFDEYKMKTLQSKKMKLDTFKNISQTKTSPSLEMDGRVRTDHLESKIHKDRKKQLDFDFFEIFLSGRKGNLRKTSKVGTYDTNFGSFNRDNKIIQPEILNTNRTKDSSSLAKGTECTYEPYVKPKVIKSKKKGDDLFPFHKYIKSKVKNMFSKEKTDKVTDIKIFDSVKPQTLKYSEDQLKKESKGMAINELKETLKNEKDYEDQEKDFDHENTKDNSNKVTKESYKLQTDEQTVKKEYEPQYASDSRTKDLLEDYSDDQPKIISENEPKEDSLNTEEDRKEQENTKYKSAKVTKEAYRIQTTEQKIEQQRKTFYHHDQKCQERFSTRDLAFLSKLPDFKSMDKEHDAPVEESKNINKIAEQEEITAVEEDIRKDSHEKGRTDKHKDSEINSHDKGKIAQQKEINAVEEDDGKDSHKKGRPGEHEDSEINSHHKGKIAQRGEITAVEEDSGKDSNVRGRTDEQEEVISDRNKTQPVLDQEMVESLKKIQQPFSKECTNFLYGIHILDPLVKDKSEEFIESFENQELIKASENSEYENSVLDQEMVESLKTIQQPFSKECTNFLYGIHILDPLVKDKSEEFIESFENRELTEASENSVLDQEMVDSLKKNQQPFSKECKNFSYDIHILDPLVKDKSEEFIESVENLELTEVSENSEYENSALDQEMVESLKKIQQPFSKKCTNFLYGIHILDPLVKDKSEEFTDSFENQELTEASENSVLDQEMVESLKKIQQPFTKECKNFSYGIHILDPLVKDKLEEFVESFENQELTEVSENSEYENSVLDQEMVESLKKIQQPFSKECTNFLYGIHILDPLVKDKSEEFIESFENRELTEASENSVLDQEMVESLKKIQQPFSKECKNFSYDIHNLDPLVKDKSEDFIESFENQELTEASENSVLDQEMVESLKKIQQPFSKECTNFLYGIHILDPLATDKYKSEELTEASENSEYDDELPSEEDLNSSKKYLRRKTEKYKKITATKKDLVKSYEVNIFDASDESELLESFQPSELISNIESSNIERNIGILQNFDDNGEDKHKNQHEMNIRTISYEEGKDGCDEISENNLNNILYSNVIVETDSPLTSNESSDSEYIISDHPNRKDSEIKSEYYQIRKDTTIETKEITSEKVSYFDLQQRNASIDLVPNFIYTKENNSMSPEDNLIQKSSLLLMPNFENILVKNVYSDHDSCSGVNQKYKLSDGRPATLRDDETSADNACTTKSEIPNFSDVEAQKIVFEKTTQIPFNTTIYKSLTASTIKSDKQKDFLLTYQDNNEFLVTQFKEETEEKFQPYSGERMERFSNKTKQEMEKKFKPYSEKRLERFSNKTVNCPEKSVNNQLIPYSKGIHLNLNGNYSLSEHDLKLDRSANVNLNFTESLVNEILRNIIDEAFLNKYISKVIERQARKNSHSVTEVETSAADQEIGEEDLDTIIKMMKRLRLFHNDTPEEKWKNEDLYEKFRHEFESDTDFSEWNVPLSNNKEIADHGFKSITDQEQTQQKERYSDRNEPCYLKLPVQKIKQNKLDFPCNIKNIKNKKKNLIQKVIKPLTKQNNDAFNKKSDIIIIEDVKSFSNYPIDCEDTDKVYEVMLRDEKLDDTSINSEEDLENKNYNMYSEEPDSFETPNSNTMEANSTKNTQTQLNNIEIIDMVNESIQRIENYFKKHKKDS